MITVFKYMKPTLGREIRPTKTTRRVKEDKDLPYVKGIHDSAGQDFILHGKTLVAVPHARPGKRIALTATPCRDESLQKGEADATYLGIENYKLCLCCEESGGKPTLKLKESDIVALYH
ncbi:interleukin-36 beta-like [Vombatus ursinus]|uniref:interleukin-36 beta-like n=1 Tax=Vombatus ursinus TaxID=29139 RepID=UPI000FFD6AEC|nr:interleukin-36 beta-like [Vombatus ursinus]